MTELIEKGYIPLDKSWIIRMGVLDIVNGRSGIIDFLNKQKNLGDDLIALQKAAETWNTHESIDVGESGTLYRFLQFASWKLELNKKFIKSGTLKNRKIIEDPNIVNLSQEELLKLDNNTSQWASASVLSGDSERLTNSPFKLKVTYEAVEHWNKKRKEGKVWEPKYDMTIKNQAETFLKLLQKQKVGFIAEQAEDFCFAYAFGYISLEEGDKKWPSLRTHESDRIEEIERSLKAAKEGKEIYSKDHRVVQAIAMWGTLNSRKMNILYPESVNKSWPQFWDFLAYAKQQI